MAGRKSSVEHLTASKMEAIIKFMEENNCGFIIRKNGKEIGIDLKTAISRYDAFMLKYSKSARKRIYIRKGGI